VNVGIAGLGMYTPPQVVTAEELSVETGIPARVLREKFGVCQVHRAGQDCHVSDMASAAGENALLDAGIPAEEVDLVVYCGSEYKDYLVWSAASKVACMLGCRRAQAFEVYALCAGTPVALRIVKDLMLAEPEIQIALLVAASKESELVDRRNQRTRFMFNFGDGAGAAVLRRGLDQNLVLGSASVVDAALCDEAIMPASGSRLPGSEAEGRDGLDERDAGPACQRVPWLHQARGGRGPYFDVPNLDRMRDRLDSVSGDNFLQVAREALERSGRGRADLLVPVHMKPSMQRWLQDELATPRAVYLDSYGHMQAADQLVGLHQARGRGLLQEGDTVLLLAAGVGYTWAATVLSWGAAGAR
jgi:3-oxoacyl-[acyl-carrier-protein] synthase-3